MSKLLKGLLTFCFILGMVWLGGRYGWKIFGFRACESAGIEEVQVTADTVYLEGFYPGSFPVGYCGYYAQQKEDKLYVGFHFSAIFGSLETGDFAVTIPISQPIHEVVVKTGHGEYSIWSDTGTVKGE